MLVEIRCDQFKSNGVVRDPIRFHKGLNTVLGTDSGNNSIGKSTFLMIIDFVFGGTDYIEKASDVTKNVGIHDIKFCFEFDGQSYFFSRSSINKNEVNVCDSDYKVTETISLDKYHKFLHEKYKIESDEQSFRGAISTFFRIYLRECVDEGHPLKNGDRAPDKPGILELIKLFNKYDAITAFVHALDEAKEKESTYRKAISYSQISAPANKTEYKNNQKEIERLAQELTDLSEKSTAGLLEVDSIKAKRVAEIKGQLSKLRRQLTRLRSQLAALSEESRTKKPVETNFSELLHFFPNANTKSLEEVEGFHAGLSEALEYEYKQKKAEIEDLISITGDEIKKQEALLRDINTLPNVSKAILESFASVKQKHDILVEANKHFDEKSALKKNVTDIENQISDVFKSELATIAVNINMQMAEFNRTMYYEDRSAPYIDIKDESHYTFDTPDDRGTGSRYKGLILFDLSVLRLTALPAVAHDSFMLKQIEDEVLEKLFELYSTTEKQIFIAMDKKTSYTKRAQQLLDESLVLRLSPGGDELFGRCWNKIVKEEEAN